MAFSDLLVFKADMCGITFCELRKNEKKMLEFIMNWNEIFTPVFDFRSQYVSYCPAYSFLPLLPKLYENMELSAFDLRSLLHVNVSMQNDDQTLHINYVLSLCILQC